MAAPVSHTIHNNTFWLLSQKALFWEEQKTIILSDLHLGKTGHFRKEGIAVPQGVYKDDLHRLFHIIQQYKPEQLIIAGDMFHSKMNKEVDLFARWRRDISQLYIRLIKGNHDILHDDHYVQADIAVDSHSCIIDKFCFVHDINDGSLEDESNNGHYYFSGHIHPGVVLKSGSRQSVCLPCYYFSPAYAVLPAFSAFTGLFPINPKKQDKVFAIVKDNVIKVR
ncbi:MAG TPA: ligase-associated DNA damage response endonuclease PdeM [Chitinophagaceae bacterium]|nr:ligase-associated DNA damage response endonuclease PdeM [Chitinophagaceae bacterium]